MKILKKKSLLMKVLRKRSLLKMKNLLRKRKNLSKKRKSQLKKNQPITAMKVVAVKNIDISNARLKS